MGQVGWNMKEAERDVGGVVSLPSLLTLATFAIEIKLLI